MPVLPSLETSQSVFSTGALQSQQINATPADFGAQVGQAAQGLGQSAERTGGQLNDIALAQQAIKNETDTNYAFSKTFSPQLQTLSAQYLALQGKDAVDQLPAYQQKMQDLQSQTRAGLANPMQQRMFDEVSRRTMMMQTDGMGRYADNQNKVYQQQASDGMVSSFQQTAAAHWNDPLAFNGALQSMVVERQTHGTMVAQPMEYTNAQIAKDVNGAWVDRLKGIASSGNAPAALALLNNGEDWTDSQGNTRHTDVRSQILPNELPAIQTELSDHAALQLGVQYGNQATSPAAPVSDGTAVGVRNNNPGNLKDPGTGQFQTFSTPQQGIQAADANLLAYQTKHGINTIQGIVNRWAPQGDGNNDPAAYAAAVSKATGIPAGQSVDLTQPGVRSQILNAMFDVESPGWRAAQAKQPVGAASGAVTGTLPVANVQAVPNASAIAPPPVGLAQDPATMKANQDANSESARQSAQAHTLAVTGDAVVAKRAGDVAAATVAGNTNAAIAAQEARQRTAAGALALQLSGNPQSGAQPITSFQQLMSNAAAFANYSQLSDEGKSAVVSRLTNPGKIQLTQEGLNTYYQMKGQAANDPANFAKQDLSKLYGTLPEAQLSDLINAQSTIVKGQTTAADKPLNWSQTKGDVDDMLKPMGLGAVAKTGTNESQQTEQFYGKLQEQMETYHEQTKKYPDTVTTRKIAATLLTQGTQGTGSMPSWLGGSSKTMLFQSPDTSKFSAAIPDTQKPALTAAFQKVYGRAPSDDELAQQYTKFILSKKGN